MNEALRNRNTPQINTFNYPELFRDYISHHQSEKWLHSFVVQNRGSLEIHFEELARDYLSKNPELAERIIVSDAALDHYCGPRSQASGAKSVNPDTRDLAVAELATYPGVIALAVHDIANKMYKSATESCNYGDFVIARYIAEQAHARTGIDIHPGAKIGDNLFIDHGTGVVIGEEAQIGKGTTMYHGSTLGAIGQTPENTTRHPIIGDNCTVSVGAKVLGYVRVGNNTVIGANATIIGNGIEIGDNVSIGPNSSIGDRGEKSKPGQVSNSTKIGNRVKIGSDVKIGDNVQLPDNVMIGNCVEISEGTGIIAREELIAAINSLPHPTIPRINLDGGADQKITIPANFQVSRGADGTLMLESMYVQRLEESRAAQAQRSAAPPISAV